MLRVFICYGGDEGEIVGKSLRLYLRGEGIYAFLASPKASDIPAGVDFRKFIDGKLLNSNLMIPICNSGIHRSRPALREIKLALDNDIPIVAFLQKGCRIPILLNGTWQPVRFEKKSHESMYRRLLVEIYRRVDLKREASEDMHFPEPEEFLISREQKRSIKRRLRK